VRDGLRATGRLCGPANCELYTDRHSFFGGNSFVLSIPSGGDCDLWWVSLSRAPQDLSALQRLLSPEERTRAAAFLRPEPRRQFVVARAALRSLLARYLGIAPTDFTFALNPHGKPALELSSPLRFNLSHSGDRVLIAMAGGIEVGVDVEWHRRVDDLDGLAGSILGPEDLECWRAAPSEERPAAFYRLWACKEAVAKAIGCGMAMDFRALHLRLDPGGPARIDALGPGWGPAEGWSLAEPAAGEGYSAAVAAASPRLHIVERNYSF